LARPYEIPSQNARRKNKVEIDASRLQLLGWGEGPPQQYGWTDYVWVRRFIPTYQPDNMFLTLSITAIHVAVCTSARK